jgi:hypothetical protein
MKDKSRRNISIIFISSLLFCLFSPLYPNNAFFYSVISFAILIQIITYWYYFLSFFPTVLKFLKSIFDRFFSWLTRSKR